MTGNPPDSALPAPFPSTHWTRLRSSDGPAAFESLARLYWKPIRAYLRAALGRRADESLDLTQGFFAWAIESGFLAKADPARGRFRAFLKVALRNYVAKAEERDAAQKRGGGVRLVPLPSGELDGADVEDRSGRTPEEILDLAWKAEVVRAAVERTEIELVRQGRPVAFAVFRDWYLDVSEAVDHRGLADSHAISMVDVANHLARAKRVWRGHLRDLVRETVGSGADLEEELAWLAGGKAP
jgi:RNA polymerase sigma-70 factor (ECF subfamily)